MKAEDKFKIGLIAFEHEKCKSTLKLKSFFIFIYLVANIALKSILSSPVSGKSNSFNVEYFKFISEKQE